MTQANMAMTFNGGLLYAPKGWLVLARTGDDLRAVHVDSGRQARVSGAQIKIASSNDSVQRALNYACAKAERELARES